MSMHAENTLTVLQELRRLAETCAGQHYYVRDTGAWRCIRCADRRV